MAGPTTAERGARRRESSGPPRVRRFKRPRLRTIVILAALLVTLGGAAGWLFYGSAWLRVEEVSVSGTRVLTPEQVREAADVPVGEPLISVGIETIEARLTKKLPRIDVIEADRSWPDGIELKVTERTPVLLVQNGDKYVEVDDGGVRFATVSRAPKGVPLLELAVSRPGSAAASLRRFGEDRLAREAVRVAGRVPDPVARDTRLVKVRSFDDISLELTGGRTVAWGSGEKGADKARALTALMKAAPGARHFDVSVPTAPASSGS
ncbi:FtsQ-type POTRA domain-containing protein [Streptomyces sp. ISL-12]|uniref:cell division protein FtsQ/DivIB n=1 Tax=Streptomyces sp. ISL-12 TaxID=2819177 RepID=UPI001BE9CC77|nr:FtsQ-type POTRA domain-containing protein [Streptomyces sp. ISL-12]MBT2412162.1 FtsQ-type POTRA domain-containing protein [Streptomyces sp. ISL-12]